MIITDVYIGELNLSEIALVHIASMEGFARLRDMAEPSGKMLVTEERLLTTLREIDGPVVGPDTYGAFWQVACRFAVRHAPADVGNDAETLSELGHQQRLRNCHFLQSVADSMGFNLWKVCPEAAETLRCYTPEALSREPGDALLDYQWDC